nr:hypothetical protein CFP56_59625 [Quercus suber]
MGDISLDVLAEIRPDLLDRNKYHPGSGRIWFPSTYAPPMNRVISLSILRSQDMNGGTATIGRGLVIHRKNERNMIAIKRQII